MNDIKSYINLMEKALVEKLFFLKYINLSDYDYVVDFGCANGTLLQYIYNNSNTKFIGYDNYKPMIEIAKKEQLIDTDNLFFTSNINDIFNLKGKSLIILSSVLHENEKNNVPFNDTLNILKQFDTIVIRDMFFDEKLNREITHEEREVLKQKIKPYIFNEFEQKYGGRNSCITNLKQYAHLLLKYDYEKNWQNEILEDYFSFDFKLLIEKLNDLNYEMIYYSHQVLKFKKDKIKAELGIDFDIPTHLKLILKRKNI